MNYNQKIEEISKNITQDYQELLQEIDKVLKKQVYKQTQAGVTVPIDQAEANKIEEKRHSLQENIKSFNYYTAFYPNKETTWGKELEFVHNISNILDKMTIDNIREEVND